MSVFDPNDNFEEWLHNDWESDDYIKSQQNTQYDEPENGGIVVNKYLHFIYVLLFQSSFLSTIIWILIIFGIVKLADVLMNIYFTNQFGYIYN